MFLIYRAECFSLAGSSIPQLFRTLVISIKLFHQTYRALSSSAWLKLDFPGFQPVGRKTRTWKKHIPNLEKPTLSLFRFHWQGCGHVPHTHTYKGTWDIQPLHVLMKNGKQMPMDNCQSPSQQSISQNTSQTNSFLSLHAIYKKVHSLPKPLWSCLIFLASNLSSYKPISFQKPSDFSKLKLFSIPYLKML